MPSTGYKKLGKDEILFLFFELLLYFYNLLFSLIFIIDWFKGYLEILPSAESFVEAALVNFGENGDEARGQHQQQRQQPV